MRKQINPNFWQGKSVFLTGHTGFKGAWLGYWLHTMGANVTGFALTPETEPSLFNLLKLEKLIQSVEGDIRDIGVLRDAMVRAKPDVVFHLAAQAIVSTGYTDPIKTFDSNVMGVVNLLEICRELGGNLAVLVISSDKCYHNDGDGRPFKIGDALGGHDPYSASKAGTEIVVGAYKSSFFNDCDGPLLASARSGNVVGGGDWSINRVLPDGARAFSRGEPLILRNPLATRPWQHVLEPLYGYLIVVEAMNSDRKLADAWNFGPTSQNHTSVGTLARMFAECWGQKAVLEVSTTEQKWSEAHTLDLNCELTDELLGWRPVLDLKTTIAWTADWYREVYANNSTATARSLTEGQIKNYVCMQNERARWGT